MTHARSWAHWKLILSSVLILLTLATSLLVAMQTRALAPAWQPGVFYAVGTLASYNNTDYKTLQAHTSQVGWEPPNVPALWQPQATSATSVPTATRTRTATSGGVATATRTRTNTTGAPTATRPPATATTGTGPACWTPWVSTTAYNGGSQVSRYSTNYQAAFWTQGNDPATSSGPAGSGQPWIPMGSCSGGTNPTATRPPATATRTNTPGGPTATRPPATATPQPCTNCGGGLPRHVITGYWHNFNNGSTMLRLRDVPSTYGLVAIAFGESTANPGEVVFNLDPTLSSSLGYTKADFMADVNTLKSQGRKVIISVGGEKGNVIVNDATSASRFANSINALMNEYRFDGVDIDLEHGINVTYMTNALRQLAGLKPGLIITMAPQTIDMQSTGSSYFQLALNIKDILTIVNMQYYNSGTMLGCNGAVYAQGTVDFLVGLACIQLQGGLRPDQVGLGVPAVPSAAGGGYVSPTVVNNALDCLSKGVNCGSFRPSTTWPGIRGAMTWSINWDATVSYSWSNTVYNHFSQVP